MSRSSFITRAARQQLRFGRRLILLMFHSPRQWICKVRPLRRPVIFRRRADFPQIFPTVSQGRCPNRCMRPCQLVGRHSSLITREDPEPIICPTLRNRLLRFARVFRSQSVGRCATTASPGSNPGLLSLASTCTCPIRHPYMYLHLTGHGRYTTIHPGWANRRIAEGWGWFVR